MLFAGASRGVAFEIGREYLRAARLAPPVTTVAHAFERPVHSVEDCRRTSELGLIPLFHEGRM